MHLRSNKNPLVNKVPSVKVHKKTIRKTPVKNIVKELKSNTNENVSYSIEFDEQMDLVKMIILYNECILFLQKEYILKNQEKEDASRILNKIELTDFETMSFVCPELNFWKHQF